MKEVKNAIWTQVKDPLHWLDCPHCGKTIFISTPNFIGKLVKWAKNLKELK